MAVGISTTVRNNECNDTADRLNSGKVQIYDGTRPANADTAVTTQTKLAEFTLQSPSFGDSVAGVASALGVPIETMGLAAGTATWGRLVSSGSVKYMDGSAGTSGADFILNSTTIAIGQAVQLTALSYSRPAGG